MARLKSGTDLEALRRQQIELAQKIKAAESKARQKEKADNERREQIAGRILLAYVAQNAASDNAKTIMGILNTAMVRPSERELFFDNDAAPANDSPAPPPSAAVNCDSSSQVTEEAEVGIPAYAESEILSGQPTE